jgi:DtxR family Mn-dependent transcriptional regulator
MADAMHPPVDEYLEAILELEEEGARVIQARLADRLGVSAPSVSEMVRRLRAEGYLEINGDRTLSLTQKGRDWATTIVRRHRLAERLLTDILGLPWHRAHIEACRWEHVISAEVEELIRAKLDNPQTCPHGNPIPGAGAPEIELVLLSQTQAGDAIRLERVSEELEIDHDALVYLDDHGFVPGVVGRVSTVAPDQTRLVTLDGDTTIAVGSSIAHSLYVSLQPA